MGDLESSQTKASQSSQGSEQIETSNRSSFDFAEGDSTAPTSIGTSPELRSTDAANPGTYASRALKPIEHTPSRRFPSFDSVQCESCAIYIPEDTWKKLPAGAPGSPRAGGIGRNGSAVLRSKESLQVYGSPQYDSDNEDESAPHQHSSPESFASTTSASSSHTHNLTYISTSSPTDPSTYSLVRNAILRTLSGEVLPRGTTAGVLSFGDPMNGYTIAYKFQLPDPQARGGHRDYALLAVAGNERRACQATALIWSQFQHIAADIMTRTELVIQIAKKEEVSGDDDDSQPGLMSVSSFLTGRMTDPDGFPRYNGGVRARPHGRNLTEMVDDDKFFAELHIHFIALLRDLRWRFGG